MATPPECSPAASLTDEASRIMPVRAVVSNKATMHWRQWRRTACWWWPSTPAFAGASVVQAANDKQQIEPMVEKLKTLPEELGKPETLLADNGYFSASNVTGCETADIAPLIATGRDAHHPSLAECAATAPGKPQDPTAVQAMAHRLQTQEGKQLYALRKQVPNRCSASSNRYWASGSSCCAGWTASAARSRWGRHSNLTVRLVNSVPPAARALYLVIGNGANDGFRCALPILHVSVGISVGCVERSETHRDPRRTSSSAPVASRAHGPTPAFRLCRPVMLGGGATSPVEAVLRRRPQASLNGDSSSVAQRQRRWPSLLQPQPEHGQHSHQNERDGRPVEWEPSETLLQEPR
jgi:hypothetical protein